MELGRGRGYCMELGREGGYCVKLGREGGYCVKLGRGILHGVGEREGCCTWRSREGHSALFVQRILVRMTKAHVSVNDWKALYKTVYNGILVCDLCTSLPQHIMIFKRVREL